MATNREVQIKYVFIELYKKAYPSLEKKKQYRTGQDLWNQVKKDQEKYRKWYKN